MQKQNQTDNNTEHKQRKLTKHKNKKQIKTNNLITETRT